MKQGDHSDPKQRDPQNNPDIENVQGVSQGKPKENEAEVRKKKDDIDLTPILPKEPDHYTVDNGGIDDSYVPYHPPKKG